jgi:hypothetical protein|tara:strand:- start:6818 stop:7195 length:378 start_codon:yes stop_codon:yes gene_type:complete
MFKKMFSIQNINNGALSVAGAMPQKDSTSSNESQFQMSRKTYVETEPIVQGKKWMGGSRDASDVSRRKRTIAVGKGTNTENGTPLSFTTYKDVNTTNDAIRRVRSGGAVAPAKKNASKINPLTPF